MLWCSLYDCLKLLWWLLVGCPFAWQSGIWYLLSTCYLLSACCIPGTVLGILYTYFHSFIHTSICKRNNISSIFQVKLRKFYLPKVMQLLSRSAIQNQTCLLPPGSPSLRSAHVTGFLWLPTAFNGCLILVHRKTRSFYLQQKILWLLNSFWSFMLPTP